MIEKTQDTFYHESVHQWLERGGDFLVASQSFVNSHPVMTERHGRRVFEQHFKLGEEWVKLAVSVLPNEPIADCFATKGYGHTGVSTPRFLRRGTQILEDSTKLGEILDRFPSDRCLHGQGATSIAWLHDFRNPKINIISAKDTTKYVPHDGNQTGAHWDYMQYSTPVEDHDLAWWRQQLYAHARYGGRFVHEDGRPVAEADYPRAVLSNGSHFHRDTPTWIQYTKRSEPWRDRADMRTADDQHFSVYDALCEVYAAHPHDEALRWEVIFAAHRFLFQVPGHDKGTYQWDPGQARAQGRIPKFAAKCVRALMAAGEEELAKAVGIRCAERLNSQVALWSSQITRGELVWPHFEGYGKHSIAENGIHWMGLDHAQKLFRDFDIKFLEDELQFMKDEIARLCFDAFFQHGEAWVIPYYVTSNWARSRADADLNKAPSGGGHLAWLAARHAIPRNWREEQKMDALIKLGDRIPDRFKGDLADGAFEEVAA